MGKGQWSKPKFEHQVICRNPDREALNWQIAEDEKKERAEKLAEEERIREEEHLEYERQEEERLRLRHKERQDLLDSQAVLVQDAKVSSMSIDYEFLGNGMFVIEFDNGHRLYFCSSSYETLQFAGSDFYSPGVTHSDELHDCDEIN